MPDPHTFLTELQSKNQASVDRLTAAFIAAIEKETLEAVDLVRLALRATIESAEVMALWLVTCDQLELKIALCEMCGHRARHFRLLSARLAELTGSDVPYDPREGGYSKLFAFLRGLQTTEERTSAGLTTLGAFNKARHAVVAERLRARGDTETQRLFVEVLPADEQKAFDAGMQALITSIPDEECQARARRAAFRTLDLLGETIEPLQIRKSLPKRR